MPKLNTVRIDPLIISIILIVFMIGIDTVRAEQEYMPGELVVKLNKGVKLGDVDVELAHKAMSIVDSVPELGLYVIKVPDENMESMQRSLSINPDFEYIFKNYLVYKTATPNDAFFNFQTFYSVFDARQAWDHETGDADVVIAILDTGVDATHEDLSGKVLPGCSTLLGFDENNCGTDTNDINGHGTGTSGTAAAQTNNGTGVAGTCWGCSILPVKVIGNNGIGSLVDTIQGIMYVKNYALNNPTKKVIVNMSHRRQCDPDGAIQAEQDAIDLAWNSGVLLISSAGNESNSLLQCPAAAANMIAVSATDNNDNLASFSSFGNFIDLAAPGVGIYNTFASSANPPFLYSFWAGTSFSAPIVAGVAGLVWSANMSLSNQEVDQILRDSAEKIGDSFFFGDGKVNANAAVLAALGEPPPQVFDPILMELFPGKAGGTSTLTVMDAPPGSTVIFKFSRRAGTQRISEGVCNGESLFLNNPNVLGSSVADDQGIATINVFIPQVVKGQIVLLQAQVEDISECNITNRITQIVGSNTPGDGDLTLFGLTPGIAGGMSSITITNAPPGETIKFKYSSSRGTSRITGGLCNAQNLDLENHKNIGMAIADETGVANLKVRIPQSGSGVPVSMQAYTETGPLCGISNRVTQVIQ